MASVDGCNKNQNNNNYYMLTLNGQIVDSN